MMVMMMMMVRGRSWCGWLWIERRGKMMKLRRMMLRRKTDPKTAKHTLCEPAQSQCTWDISQEAFCAENLQGKCQTLIPAPAFCASLRSRNAHGLSQEEFCGDIYRKMPHASPTDIVLCELAQSKCTWTCHKRHFVRKFRGKMPDANPGASILWTCHKRHFVRKFTRKTPDASNTYHLDWTPGLI